MQKKLGKTLRLMREKLKIPLRKAATLIDIDTAILSKMERGERKLSKTVIIKLASIYNTEARPLITQFLAETIVDNLKYEEAGIEALHIAEKQLKQQRTK